MASRKVTIDSKTRLFIDIRHEILKSQNWRRQMVIKGVGYIADQKSDWRLAEECAERILELLH